MLENVGFEKLVEDTLRVERAPRTLAASFM
jgi:hypothetical protein